MIVLTYYFLHPDGDGYCSSDESGDHPIGRTKSISSIEDNVEKNRKGYEGCEHDDNVCAMT